MRLGGLAASIGLALGFGLTGTAPAATITVEIDRTGDVVGPFCELSDAIRAANQDRMVGWCDAGDGDDVIVFAAQVTGTLTIARAALPDIASNLTIQGPGADLLSISGEDTYPVFTVTSGSVEILDLTLANGLRDGDGGARRVEAGAAVALRRCRVTENAAKPGTAR